MTRQELDIIEAHELQLHRIRTKVLSFKTLAEKACQKKQLTKNDFIYLLEAARVSDDYNDSLTLNKFTCMFADILNKQNN